MKRSRVQVPTSQNDGDGGLNAFMDLDVFITLTHTLPLSLKWFLLVHINLLFIYR